MQDIERTKHINDKLQNIQKRSLRKSALENFELDYVPNPKRSSTASFQGHEIPPSSPASYVEDPFTEESQGAASAWLRRDSFHREIAKKTQLFLIGQQEAEIEVTVDRLVKEHGNNKDKALLYVVSQMFGESKIHRLVNTLLHRGAQPFEEDGEGRTALHHAVEKNFDSTARRLLDHGANPHKRDKAGVLPYKIAHDRNNDDLAAMLVAYTPNVLVRALYTSNGNKKAEFSFHELLKTKMQQTKLTVLDCMKESEPSNKYTIYYQILDCDEQGRAPTHENFNPKSKSALHILASTGDKEVVYHDVVRLLLRRKWKLYARFRFCANAISFLISVFAMTYALIIASNTPDPMIYDSPLQISRGFFEVYALLVILFHLILEIIQMVKHLKDYWLDAFNWLDLSSVLVMLSLLPLRFTNTHAQWAVFAVGYVLWTMRIFKYAPVFRSTGAFAQILWIIITRDFFQFMIVFMVFLLTFTGSFTLILRWENNLTKFRETSNFWWVLFTGTRILAEQQPPIEEYVGENGYGPFAIFLMVVFLFTCLVVLVNILIAQLSDTYQNIQKDAQRGLELDRAWIIKRIEINGIMIGKSFRERYYKEVKEVDDPKDLLQKWENPPLYDTSRAVHDIRDRLDVQDLSMRTINSRLVRQEHTLARIQQQLEELLDGKKEQTQRTSVDGHANANLPVSDNVRLSDKGARADPVGNACT